jgi:flagellar hook-associated protein 2
MSDILSSILSSLQSSTSTSSSSSSSTPTTQSDLLVASYKQTQQSKLDTLSAKQKDLQTRQAFYNTLNSKINTLLSSIDTFTASNSNSKFVTRTISSSDTSVATATATSDAIPGFSTLKVNRLAANDTLIGKQMLRTDSSGLTGVKTFTIKGTSTALNPATITVDFGSTPLSNEDAMKLIVSTVNAYKSNNSNDTIGLGLSASYVKDSPTTGRVTFTSTITGSDYAISFDDNESGVLSDFLGLGNVTSGRSSTDTNQTAAHFMSQDTSTLNSEIVVNGVTVTNNSNSISDVLPGITINLLDKTDTDKTLTLKTDVDTKAVQSLIQPLLTAYNDLLTFSKSNKTILSSDPGISSLSSDLRALSTQTLRNISDPISKESKSLADIGVKIASDGTLTLSDTTKLDTFLKQVGGAQKVAELFTTVANPSDSSQPYGLAARLNDLVKRFTGYTDSNGNNITGIIKSKNLFLSQQIENNTKKTQELQDRIDKQAESLRKQYESTLKVYLEAQNQYSSFLGIQNSLYTSSTGSTTG